MVGIESPRGFTAPIDLSAAVVASLFNNRVLLTVITFGPPMILNSVRLLRACASSLSSSVSSLLIYSAEKTSPGKNSGCLLANLSSTTLGTLSPLPTALILV